MNPAHVLMPCFDFTPVSSIRIPVTKAADFPITVLSTNQKQISVKRGSGRGEHRSQQSACVFWLPNDASKILST